MGALWSCCGLRDEDGGEREPLLPKYKSQQPESTRLPPPDNTFERIADIFVALKAGKLPSHQQITHLINLCVQSDILNIGRDATSSRYLSEEGKRLLTNMKEFLVAVRQYNSDKNYDDSVQNLVYSALHPTLQRPPIPVRVTADEWAAEVPTSSEVSSDFDVLIHSLFTLLIHTLTAATFRLVLSELLFSLRAITANAATRIERAAKQVGEAAEGIEQTAQVVERVARDATTVEDIKEGADDLAGRKSEETASTPKDNEERANLEFGEESQAKWTAIRRFRQVLYQIHEDPQHQAALLTVLSLLDKYASIGSSTADGVSSAHAELDPELADQLAIIRVLIERSASGRSLEPFLHILRKTFTDVLQSPSQSGLRPHFEKLTKFFRQSITQTEYLQTPTFLRDASQFYDTTQELMETEAEFATDIRALLTECEDYSQSITADPATRNLSDTASALKSSLSEFATNPGRQKQALKDSFQRDLLSWVFPHFLRLLKALPLPRIEAKTNKIDAALDSAYLALSTDITPRTITTRAYTEVVIDFSESGSVATSSRLKIHVDGMKMDAKDVGYYFQYKNLLGVPLLGFEDEGLVSVLSGEGLSFEVDIEGDTQRTMDQDISLPPSNRDASDCDTSADPLFRVRSAQVSTPGLTISIDKSKHWLLNKLFVQPISGPAVRLAIANTASQQVKDLLEKVACVGGEIVREAEKRAARRKETESPSLTDWYGALIEKGGLLFGQEGQEEDEDEETEPETHAESHTAITSRGILHISRTQVEDQNSEEVALAVGAGPQLFPGKGGPHGESRENLVQAVEGVGSEVYAEALHKGAEGVNRVRELEIEVERGRDRANERGIVERRDSEAGWRTTAFDI